MYDSYVKFLITLFLWSQIFKLWLH